MSRTDEFKALAAKIKKGGAPKYHEKNAAEGKLFCRERIALLFDDGGTRLRRGRPARQQRRAPTCPPTAWSPASASVHGRPVAIMANDSTVKAGSWGARTVEKIVRIQETAGRLRRAALLPGRLGGRAHHRSDRHVPRAAPRRAHLPQPGAPVGRGAADLPAVRPVGGGRRLHPGVLRRGVHGRQERVDVPRLAAHGRDGDRREGHARGDGRRAHALRGLGLRRPAGQERAGLHRAPRATTSPTCRSAPGETPPRGRAARAARRRPSASTRSCPPTTTRPSTSPQVIDALVDEGSFFEVKKLFAREMVTGFARLDGRVGRHRRQPAEVEGRRAVRRLGRQGGALHLAVRRLRASRCCSSPTCPAS